MTDFPAHTMDSAPEDSREALEGIEKAFGFVPNMLAVMAESPALLASYLTIGNIFGESGLSPLEQQVVLLAVSHTNGCNYCVAAHSAIATTQQVPADVIKALRSGNAIADPKLEALRRFTAAVVGKAGWVEEDLGAFLGAGYEKSHVLDVLVGVGMKTMSNYTNHIAHTELDAQFAEQEIELRKAG